MTRADARTARPFQGRVFFDTPDPPRPDTYRRLEEVGIEVEPCFEDDDGAWALRLRHRAWGEASLGAFPGTPLPDAMFLAVAPGLTLSERGALKRIRSSVLVEHVAPVGSGAASVFEAGKRMLRWLFLAMDEDGIAALDDRSTVVWSREALRAELVHDAPLDASSLHVVHAVHVPGEPVTWVHTHGLAAAGAFDLDVLRPSPEFVCQAGVDALAALACEVLLGHVAANAARHEIAEGATVALVPARTFMRRAQGRDRRVRDAAETHADDRSVLCEPADRSPAWAMPASYFRTFRPDGPPVRRSAAARHLVAERARRTFPVFRALCDEFHVLGVEPAVRVGAPDGTGDASRDPAPALWLLVHEARDDAVDASVLASPAGEPSLPVGRRGWWPLESVCDWRVVTPLVTLTPRSAIETRHLRESCAAAERFVEPPRSPRARRDRTRP